MTFGNGDAIYHLVLLEDRVDLHRLLEETLAKVDLVRNAAAVNLDLHQMGLLLFQRRLADLGVCENTDHSAVLLDTLELTVNGFARVLGVLLSVFGEGLLLGLVPIFVEATLNFIAEMFGPDSGE